MQIKILAFGIAKEIIGGTELSMDLAKDLSVGELKEKLTTDFPEFAKLRSLALAVNGTYVGDDLIVTSQDEVVIIPPVSGG